MNAGDVALVNFPFSDGSNAKRRPVLVVGVSPTGINEDSIVVVVQITSSTNRLANLRHGDLAVPNWQAQGFPKPSVIRCRRIFGTQPGDVIKVFSSIDPALLADVRTELKALLAL